MTGVAGKGNRSLPFPLGRRCLEGLRNDNIDMMQLGKPTQPLEADAPSIVPPSHHVVCQAQTSACAASGCSRATVVSLA